MNNTQLVSRELDRAREKHPHFVDFFDRDPKIAQSRLQSIRNVLRDAVNHRETTFPLVLQCEVREATAAHASGDYGTAIVELAHCAAVCIRAMDHVRETRSKRLDARSCWDMRYGEKPDSTDGAIASGTYRGVPYLVLNRSGKHPCAYIDIRDAVCKPELRLGGGGPHSSWKGVEPHGGWTYDEIGVKGCGNSLKLDRWIGWDYAHAGDYTVLSSGCELPGHRWTTAEIVDEIMDVIDALYAAGVFNRVRLGLATPAPAGDGARPFSAESVPAGGKERFCGMDLATRPSVTVIQVQRDPGETDEQFRDRLNRAIVALSPDGVGDVGADAIERTVRDAIRSYVGQYFKAGSAEAEKEIVERITRANAWLVAHGFKPEPVAWSKEEAPCL